MTHGASAYVNHGCRCPVCTAANTARVREYRKRRMHPRGDSLMSNSGQYPVASGGVTFADWHGWRVADVNLHVGRLPGRKSVVLYTFTHNGSVIHPLAYFKTEADARTCLAFLDTLAASRFVLDTLEQVS